MDHVIAKNATVHKVNSNYALAISYCTFCVGKRTILGPDIIDHQTNIISDWLTDITATLHILSLSLSLSLSNGA